MQKSPNTITILIIEDNPDNQQLATWILEDEGYSATSVFSAEDGLVLMEQQAFDLVLMDISLPGISGKEATRRIKADPRFRHIPVLALTAHASANEHESIIASGVNGLLTKPLEEDKLLGSIANLLEP